MNKQNIQFMLAQNKLVIRDIENAIEYFREEKRVADITGEIIDEYESHEALKYLRKHMKKYVTAQKLLKSLMKG